MNIVINIFAFIGAWFVVAVLVIGVRVLVLEWQRGRKEYY